jgi:hypothetical protein
VGRGRGPRWCGVGRVALAAAQPAAASYQDDDTQRTEFTFVRNGRSLTCGFTGLLLYSFPHGEDETAWIRVMTAADQDDECVAATAQVSLSGTFETAPDSNRFVAFSAQAPTSGTIVDVTTAYTEFYVPGPTGHIATTHLVRYRCDNPPAGATFCSATVTTSAK